MERFSGPVDQPVQAKLQEAVAWSRLPWTRLDRLDQTSPRRR